MIAVFVHRAAQERLDLLLVGHVFERARVLRHVAEGDVDGDLIIGDDERTVVRQKIDRIRADGIFTGHGIGRAGEVGLDVPGVVCSTDDAVRNAVLRKLQDGALELLIIADQRNIAVGVRGLRGAVRADLRILRRKQCRTPAEHQQKKGHNGQSQTFHAAPPHISSPLRRKPSPRTWCASCRMTNASGSISRTMDFSCGACRRRMAQSRTCFFSPE